MAGSSIRRSKRLRRNASNGVEEPNEIAPMEADIIKLKQRDYFVYTSQHFVCNVLWYPFYWEREDKQRDVDSLATSQAHEKSESSKHGTCLNNAESERDRKQESHLSDKQNSQSKQLDSVHYPNTSGASSILKNSGSKEVISSHVLAPVSIHCGRIFFTLACRHTHKLEVPWLALLFGGRSVFGGWIRGGVRFRGRGWFGDMCSPGVALSPRVQADPHLDNSDHGLTGEEILPQRPCRNVAQEPNSSDEQRHIGISDTEVRGSEPLGGPSYYLVDKSPPVIPSDRFQYVSSGTDAAINVVSAEAVTPQQSQTVGSVMGFLVADQKRKRDEELVGPSDIAYGPLPRDAMNVDPCELKDGTVSSLMHTDKKEWDIELLNDIFCEEDKARILKIPLPITDHEDKIIWSSDDKGAYSVRSCYKACVGYFPTSNHPKWTKIWNLLIPPKVKIFSWQACTNSLPTAANLRARRVDVNDTCPLCAKAVESISHLFIFCDLAKSCWGKLRNVLLAPHTHFVEWLEYNMDNLNPQDLSLLLTDAAAYLEAWSTIHFKRSPPSTALLRPKWHRPPPGFLKLNVDVATDQQTNSTGLGMLLRDSDGFFINALQVKLPGVYQAKVAEVMGVREALNMVHIESDALLVVEGLKNGASCTSFDLILNDIRVLANDFSSVTFVFAKRSANEAAHLLARDALLLSDRKVWGSLPPSFITDVLLSDIS
nr:rho GTPase-activating protein REN1-like isoform X1 [Ipomoea batatas]